jgi:ABC-type amino acid transport substrate-binding protein
MHWIARAVLWAVLLIAPTSLALGQNSAPEIAPNGKLRVGMIAITVLGGVADPIAKFIGSRLGVPVEPITYPSPGAYAQSFGKDEWDIAIGPRALAPEDKADSTADMWIIDLVYVAAPGKEFADATTVDKPGVRIGTIQGAPSDRVLSREIKSAEIIRIPLSPRIASDAAELLRNGKADVFGADSGVGYPAAEALRGAKVVPGVFATVRVAAALPKGRSSTARAKLDELVDEAKRTGVIQLAIEANGLKGVSVAPK